MLRKAPNENYYMRKMKYPSPYKKRIIHIYIIHAYVVRTLVNSGVTWLVISERDTQQMRRKHETKEKTQQRSFVKFNTRRTMI